MKRKMDVTKIKQAPEVINSIVFDFIDYKGDTHKITVVAVNGGHTNSVDGSAYALSVGVSICNPSDEYIPIIGINRAAKMALKNPKIVIVGSYKGIYSDKITSAFLESEKDFIMDNINLYIHGYKESAEKWLAKNSNN